MASARGSSRAVDLPSQSARVVETFAVEDLALAVERQVIGIFADQDMGQKTWARATALEGRVGSGA